MENNLFLKEISDFVFTSKYSRYDEKRGRRETWNEAVSRLEKMHLKKFSFLPEEDLNKIKWAFDKVREKLVAPSMRSLQFGGKAVEAHQARIYNCSMKHIDSLRSFAECFYLLLCGCGVGVGLSKKFLDRLPDLVNEKDKTGTVVTYVVEDDIEGWADSVEALLMCYFKNTPYTGRKIVFDYSRIRPAGTPLKTGGGKAPGYRGLKQSHAKIKALLDYIIEELEQKRLETINAYDILMHSSDAVLSGGIRRSAMSVVFDADDLNMLNAKTYFVVSKHKRFSFDEETSLHYGTVTVNKKQYSVALNDFDYKQLVEKKIIGWYHIEPQRARSNNSVLLLRDKVTKEKFADIIQKTREFGEPGFVFADNPDQLFNPCFEISTVPVTKDGLCGVQFCNLTTQNGRLITSREVFREAVEAATIIGTLQASYTNFPYLSNAAKHLTEEEALLGVSITGIMENPDILLNPEIQKEMALYAVQINETWASKLHINPAARVTCVKPEGSSSLVLGTSSGIHPHHSHKYFRRIQCNKLDNVYKLFKETNPHACEESVWSATKTDDVVTFPIQVSEKSITKDHLSAKQQLEYIKVTQNNWVKYGTGKNNKKQISHNVSSTVLVKEDEWPLIIDFIFENKDSFAAVSLLPELGDKLYKQAPNESVETQEDELKWNNLISNWKPTNYKNLYEDSDETEVQQEFSCAGGQCELKKV